MRQYKLGLYWVKLKLFSTCEVKDILGLHKGEGKKSKGGKKNSQDFVSNILLCRSHSERHLPSPGYVSAVKESYVNKVKVSPNLGNKWCHPTPTLRKHAPPRVKERASCAEENRLESFPVMVDRSEESIFQFTPQFPNSSSALAEGDPAGNYWRTSEKKKKDCSQI